MRLAIVSSEFPPGPGGIGTHAYQLASNLAADGWQVGVCTPQHYAEEHDITAWNELQPFSVHRLASRLPGPLRLPAGARQIRRAVRSLRPEVMLASGDRAIYAAALLAKTEKLPWLAVEHGRVPPAAEQWIKRWAFESANAIVGVSSYSLSRLLEGLGIESPRTEVIHNGADPSAFRVLPEEEGNHFRSDFGLEGKKLLVTVGNVTSRKGQDVVIRAMPRVIEKVPDAHYLIVGLPTLEAQFKRLAGELGVSAHVHFLGRLDDSNLLRCLNASDLFVMTSRHTALEFEGFGIAVIEAALCGKCAVVSDDSGLVEAIVDGETGLAVPMEDPDATAHAIVSLLGNDNLRARMATAAHRRAATEQTWAQKVRDYGNLLEQLAEGQTSRMAGRSSA